MISPGLIDCVCILNLNPKAVGSSTAFTGTIIVKVSATGTG